VVVEVCVLLYFDTALYLSSKLTSIDSIWLFVGRVRGKRYKQLIIMRRALKSPTSTIVFQENIVSIVTINVYYQSYLFTNECTSELS
jgi:hypothetical protein